MPDRNGTGRNGLGPMTGRGMGKCNPKKTSDKQAQTMGQGRGQGKGKGSGQGQRRGHGRGSR